MKSYRQELWFELPRRVAFVNITLNVEEALRKSGIREGFCLVNAMHITASVFINDDEAGLHQDFERWLEELAPHEPLTRYRHNLTGEENGGAHCKRQVMGREVVIAVTDASSTLARGSRSSTANSTAAGASEYSSRLLENEGGRR
jgi:secondary thiamine-phosphate synthase enzyme